MTILELIKWCVIVIFGSIAIAVVFTAVMTFFAGIVFKVYCIVSDWMDSIFGR